MKRLSSVEAVQRFAAKSSLSVSRLAAAVVCSLLTCAVFSAHALDAGQLLGDGAAKATLKVKIGDAVYTSETTQRGGTLVFSNEDLAAALSGKEVTGSTFAFDEAAYLAEADGGAFDPAHMQANLKAFPNSGGMPRSTEMPIGKWMIGFSNETYNAVNDRYFDWTYTTTYIPHWKGVNLSYRASPADGLRVLDFSQLQSVIATIKGAGLDVVDPFAFYVKGAEDGAVLPHVIKYWDRTKGHKVNFDTSAAQLTATCPKPTLDEIADGKVSVADFDPTGVTHYLLTLEVREVEPDVALTIPTIDHATLKSVKVDGVALEPDEDGKYVVPAGTTVTVKFEPEEGYVLNRLKTDVVVNETMELPEALRPQAVAVEDLELTVNEVMAKNGSTITTKLGVAGLDWVELKNAGDMDVDLSDWLLFNDPTAAASKWTSIKGSCIVPAHGFKLVWCDKDKLCPSEGFAEDEAYVRCNLSTDANKHTVFIAPAADAETIVDQVALPEGMKDVSYGRKSADGALAYFKEPTPGAENTTHGYGPMTPPVFFTVPHGYKSAAFDLAIACGVENAEIRYTLDGSSPISTSTLYTKPIRITKTTVIRAAVVDANSLLQRDASASYLFAADILAQARGTVPAGFPKSGEVKGQLMRYGFDQAYVAQHRDVLMAGLTNRIPTVSLVIDPKHLFDENTGIYVNSKCDGREWERQTMVEQIDPRDAENGFTVPAGLRIRGASCRKAGYPKHSFRLFFRSEYGRSSLDFPLFGDEGADSFEKIDLRTSQNFSWANADSELVNPLLDPVNDPFINECFARDVQGAMGECYTKTRSYNLFINGQFWGLYQTQERGDENFAETYNGGEAANYDVIKTSNVWTEGSQYPTLKTGAVEGTDEAWSNLWDIAVRQSGTGGVSPANYNRLLGLNPDGTPNEAYPVYLNPTNLATFILSTHYACDLDSPFTVIGFVPNNICAIRNRVAGDADREGFIFLRHDCENSVGVHPDYGGPGMDTTALGTDGWTPIPLPKDMQWIDQSPAKNVGYDYFSPAELHWKLEGNPEYKMLVADLLQRHLLREDGVLTSANALPRFLVRAAEVEEAIAGECGRWSPDVAKYNPNSWSNACMRCVDFINSRPAYLLQFYRDRGWYPNFDAPTAVDAQGTPIPEGTVVPASGKVRLTAAAGARVYYTLDGSDPRAVGGAVAGNAIPFEGDVSVPPEGLKFTMRALKNGEWSALDTIALKGEMPGDLADPKDAVRVAAVYSSTAEGEDEFIVLTNIADKTVLLSGITVTCAKSGKGDPSLTLTLPAELQLEVGAFIHLDQATYWPDQKITDGEVDMLLTDAHEETIQTLYFNANDWFDGAVDGTGAWLVAIDFGTVVTEESQWRPSVEEPSGKWTEPADDSPAAIAAALEEDGFGPATQGAFQDLGEYNAFKDYCVNVLGLGDPNAAEMRGVKANALLGYALGSPVVPEDFLESDDVTITSMELQGSSSVQLTVTVEGFEPDDLEQVQSALQAAVSAKGGESLADMSADQVTVEASVEDGALIVVIVPKKSADTSFFVQMLIRE